MKLTTLFSAAVLVASCKAGLVDYFRVKRQNGRPGRVTTQVAVARPAQITTTPAAPRQPATTTARPVTTVRPTTTRPTTTMGKSTTAAAAPQGPVAFNAAYTPVVGARDTRLVWAHFMMGNTFGQGFSWFDQEIKLARSMGIDGFACNVGFEDWQPARLATLYQAAEANPGFKVFVSLDFATLYNRSPENLADTFVVPFASSPAQYKVGGRSYLSTFMGEFYQYTNYPETARLWLYFKNYLLAKNVGIFFVPVFTGRGPTTNGWAALDGTMTWEMWTKGVGALNYYLALRDNPSQQSDIKYGTLSNDQLSTYTGKVHMAGVSPLFFTHYGSKNWIFRDDFLYNERWQNLINGRPDSVEIVSWNDFGESHYIGSLDPQVGDYYQESSSSAVDWTLRPGMDHLALGPLTSYYIQTYKNGGTPPALSQNIAFFSYRPHSMSATASNDPLGKPSCGQPGNIPAEGCALADNIYITVLAAQIPFAVTMTSGSKMTSFSVNKLGENRFTFSGFLEGIPVLGLPNGVRVNGPGRISNTITTYNYNHFMKSVTFSA